MSNNKQKLFSEFKLKDVITLMILLSITIISIYFYVNTEARNQAWQKAYPIRAKLANYQTTCSPKSPSWMQEAIHFQTLNNNAPANQIAYITPQGQIYHCENGYIGEMPFFSKPIDEHTRFRYASVTKLWTSDAILALIREGKLTFGTKLASIITEINQPKDSRINDITIGDLLLHRGGFNRYSATGHDMFGIGQPICPDHFERLNTIRLDFDPNSKMMYSNLGYCLLGEVVSRLNKQPYTQVMDNQYKLTQYNIKFIDNSKLSDEVNYNYVETGLTGIGDIYTVFDYKGLASVAGLSGNAISLANQVKNMVNKPMPNILSLDDNLSCDITKLRDCYGYAMFPYQAQGKNLKVYFRDGTLLGLSSLVAVDSNGGVVVLLSNGVSSLKQDGSDRTKMLIYQYLIQQYK